MNSNSNSNSNSNQLSIQLYADCATPEMAQTIARNLLSALHSYQPQLMAAPLAYWKIPEFYAFDLRLQVASEAAFQALIATPPLGWTHGGDEYDRSCVWNWTEDGDYFGVPQARWVEVQFSLRETS